MTSLREFVVQPADVADGRARTRCRRLIAVGVRDHAHDHATIEWAVADACIGMDTLHVVHAYEPLRLNGCAWEPVSRARNARYMAARRVVAQAVQRASAKQPGLRADGSAIAGSPEEVLEELSDVVDLIVIGDDSALLTATRMITRRVQDVARCPVVCVPPGYSPIGDPRPVTVVADGAGLNDAAMCFGADAAGRRGVALQVSRSWSSLNEGEQDGAGWVAEQQEELDAQLAGWRLRHPEVAMVGRIELDDGWLDRVRDVSTLIVTSASSASSVRARRGVGARTCPVATVPG